MFFSKEFVVVAVVAAFLTVGGLQLSAYRAGVPMADAVRLLREGAGTHFDPHIVEVVEALQARGLLGDLAE